MSSKVGMEQGLEPAATAESHQAVQRKTSQDQADTPSQQETPQLQTERDREEERKGQKWEAGKTEQRGRRTGKSCTGV